MELEKYVNSQRLELRKTINLVNRSLSNLPNSKVAIRRKRNTYSLAEITGGNKESTTRKERYVSLSHADAGSYATKLYLEKIIIPLKNELAALDAFHNDYKPNKKFEVISSFPPEIRTLIRSPLITMSTKAKEWGYARYKSNPMRFDERTTYITVKGDRVRSRAELIIANNLHFLNIPYRYEMAYMCNGTVFYPDFAVMNPITGEVFYVEYFGLMDDEEYRQKAFSKIREYYNSPDAARFIFIFESEKVSMDTNAIINIIIKRMGLESMA